MKCSILAQDLPFQIEPPKRASSRPLALAEIERAAIIEALARNQGDRRNAAVQLGISLRTLQYRLKDYGITPNMLFESGTDEDSDQKGTKTGPG